jgi:uncharacterized tellurite resistance protein B-like protein
MGTISQLFETGEQSSLKGHFLNLVMLARIDGKIDAAEKKLLEKIALRLALTSEQVKSICEDEESYPLIPPVNKEERLERLIQLIQMILIDGEISKEEDQLIFKYAVALGFNSEEVEMKNKIIVSQLKDGISREDIIASII